MRIPDAPACARPEGRGLPAWNCRLQRRFVARRGSLRARILLLASLALAGPPAAGLEIVQSRGADPEVDYASLLRFGPWDDRNYELTASDLEQLPPGEEEVREPLPAFFRVRLRKQWPELPTEGPAQYPRSALQIFLQQCGGFLIGGMVYTGVEVREGRYVVIEENGRPAESLGAAVDCRGGEDPGK